MESTEIEDWYEKRNELFSDMEFLTYEDRRVKLDRRVPGDGTDWYVLTYSNGSWLHEDATIQPSDLKEYLGVDFDYK